MTGSTDWVGIAVLYRALLDRAPSVGATIAAAVALAESGDAASAHALLTTLDDRLVQTHPPWWLARARLAELGGSPVEARTLASRALGLTSNPAVRDYLIQRWKLTALE